ncbi:hypothetical protein [Formosa algae]|uniref:hypothetical protein n=1 Tax=Formosa algae TaxID=225843 RepID=UPI0011AF910E|nr:hypothetical protein [Formosa algae]
MSVIEISNRTLLIIGALTPVVLGLITLMIVKRFNKNKSLNNNEDSKINPDCYTLQNISILLQTVLPLF